MNNTLDKEIVLVLDQVRSILNVGAILRVADGLGIKQVLTIGITPHTKQPSDLRLPHIVARVESQLSKTALGAEKTVCTKHFVDAKQAIDYLKTENFQLVSLEQTPDATSIVDFNKSPKNIALVVGNEISGVSKEFLAASRVKLFIPMLQEKESLNVATAAAIACYHLRYIST